MSSKKKRTAVGKARTTRAKARKAAPKKKRVVAKAKPAKKVAKAASKKASPKKAAPKAVAAKKAAPKRAASKVAAKAKPAAKVKRAAPAPIKRRDGAGHLDPKYAQELRARSRGKTKDDDRAFLAGARSADSLTEELGEEFVETITSGEDEGNEVRDQRVAEEVGGPFTLTNGNTEFAEGTDGSNPKTATREPFPRT
jgi:hypothetical protein